MAVNFTAIEQTVILTKCVCVYQPSVFNGTGQETRVNLVLAVTDAVREQVATIEAALNLGPSACSVLKGNNLKVKIDLDTLNTYNQEHEKIKPTLGQFAGSDVEVRLELRGVWKTASSSGLSIRCTDLRFCEGRPSPFARD